MKLISQLTAKQASDLGDAAKLLPRLSDYERNAIRNNKIKKTRESDKDDPF